MRKRKSKETSIPEVVMNDAKNDLRVKVVEEAETWLRTPYHHMGRVKGSGVDCGMLLAEVFERAGIVPHIEIPYYPPDWHLHREEEKYLGWVEQYAKEVTREPLPADIVLYKFGRCVSHGAIVIKWPLVIHAWIGIGVMYADATKDPLSARQKSIYSVLE